MGPEDSLLSMSRLNSPAAASDLDPFGRTSTQASVTTSGDAVKAADEECTKIIL